MKFFAANLRYPKSAQETGRQGRVFVTFCVGKDGKVYDVRIPETPDTKQVGFDLQEEAMRVVALTSGNWKPGKQRGQDVNMKYTIPITFRLQ